MTPTKERWIVSGKYINSTQGISICMMMGRSSTDKANAARIAKVPHLEAMNTGLAFDNAALEATNTDLLKALEGLTRWVGKGIADDMYADCVNPERAQDDLKRAEDIIQKAKGERR